MEGELSNRAAGPKKKVDFVAEIAAAF
jgi:hypothetical protein